MEGLNFKCCCGDCFLVIMILWIWYYLWDLFVLLQLIYAINLNKDQFSITSKTNLLLKSTYLAQYLILLY